MSDKKDTVKKRDQVEDLPETDQETPGTKNDDKVKGGLSSTSTPLGGGSSSKPPLYS